VGSDTMNEHNIGKGLDALGCGIAWAGFWIGMGLVFIAAFLGN